MKKRHYAAIDIGSNAVRLLIKCVNGVSDNPLTKVQLLRVPLRLGEDAFIDGRISKYKVRQLLKLMEAYRTLMDLCDVCSYRACATSAMRDADNSRKIVRSIARHTGIHVEIISGQQEAELAALRQLEELLAAKGCFLFADVGGGSTELSLLQDGQVQVRKSYNIGTVRLLAGVVKRSVFQEFEDEIKLMGQNYQAQAIIGTSGNINRLARMAGRKIKETELLSLKRVELETLYAQLAALSLEERMARYGLKPDRADVIVHAANIYLMLARALTAPEIIVPTSGVADGIIEALYRRDMELSCGGQ